MTMDVGLISDWFEERPINRESRQKLAHEIQEKLSFIGVEWAKGVDGIATGRSVRMLDYACGPGFLSQIIGPHVSKITAIDLSPTMIERYNRNVNKFGLAEEDVSSQVGNLLSSPPDPETLGGPEYHDFDLVAVGAALHHFPSPAEAVAQLMARLAPGGVLFVQDLCEDANFQGEKSTRPRGFSRSDMEGVMAQAGLCDFDFEVLPGPVKVELPSEEVLEVECFIARAKKPRE